MVSGENVSVTRWLQLKHFVEWRKVSSSHEWQVPDRHPFQFYGTNWVSSALVLAMRIAIWSPLPYFCYLLSVISNMFERGSASGGSLPRRSWKQERNWVWTRWSRMWIFRHRARFNLLEIKSTHDARPRTQDLKQLTRLISACDLS